MTQQYQEYLPGPDFVLLFGESTSAKFLEKWPTAFKDKVIHQSKGLCHSYEVQELIEATELTVEENQDEVDLLGLDSNLSSLITAASFTPTFCTRLQKPRQDVCDPGHRAGTSIQEHLDSIEERRQPYLLAVGTARSHIHAFYIVVDKVATPLGYQLGAYANLVPGPVQSLSLKGVVGELKALREMAQQVPDLLCLYLDLC
ncbi:uncharacterized protein LOC108436984 [Pygocentrus nattereri]|uniref:uncharacterized protein LOC108436984 n=1 Tax=Pygocentrus nattereri TaxID=42514 RepID=UPI000814822E|nr:uncharacterized protein LOC108436984 [Pygocentrus nattereri]